MHIVKIWAGLGNQLFQYALYKKMKTLGYEVYVDTSNFLITKDKNRAYQLPCLGLNPPEADIKDIKRLYCNPYSKISMAIVKRIGKKTHYRQRDIEYDSSILEADEGYFDGYWQDQRYFEDILDEIRADIHFSEPDDVVNNRYKEEILNNDCSVSVHVRLGDYLNNPKMYGNVCTKDYYLKAIKRIKQEIENPVFFVFSNDINLVKEMNILEFAEVDRVVYVDENPEEKGYIDMYLMTLCRHHIIANSSFSLWGALLGEKEDSIVLSPKGWINGIKVGKIVPDRWIRI